MQIISKTLAPVRKLPFTGVLDRIPREPLAYLPTPLGELRRFKEAASLRPELYIKRDNETGLATGGNKARKLEFLIADALAQEATAVVTAGAPQSNHCRQTAAAAAHCGLECHLVIGGSPDSPNVGNLFLDNLLGAVIHWTTRAERANKISEVTAELKRQGQRPYPIPIGGSNDVGALGYVAFMFELRAQLADAALIIDRIVFATSSGGTQAGLIIGARLAGFSGRITGISIDQVPDEASSFKYREFVLEIAQGLERRLELDKTVKLEDVEINYDYLGDGYGVVGDGEREAIRLMARSEGILVDPVYAGRALAGLMAMSRRGEIAPGEKVLYLHTGGEAALGAFVEPLTC